MENTVRVEEVLSKSVSQRTKRDGRKIYVARFVYRDQTGKRRETTREARTKNEAKDKLRGLSAKYETLGKTVFTDKKIRVKQLLDKFSKDCVKEAVYNNGVKVSGYKSLGPVKSYIKTLNENLGFKELKNLTYNDIKMYKEKRLSTVSPYTKSLISITQTNRELQMFRRILNYAVENRWLSRNPFNDGKNLIQTNQEAKRTRILTEEEEVRLIAQLVGERSHILPVVLIALDTGFRKNEILTLEWQDIQLEPFQIGEQFLRNGFLRIRKENSKTNEERFSATTDRVNKELKHLFDEAKNKATSVETLNSTKIFEFQGFKTAFNTAKRLAEIENLVFHDLRHVLTTRLARGGMSESEAMKITGHKNRDIFDRYHNLDLISLLRQQDALDNYSDNLNEQINH